MCRKREEGMEGERVCALLRQHMVQGLSIVVQREGKGPERVSPSLDHPALP